MKKIVTRIKGGLGNQLFCYAAARRLALINNAELIIDDVSGFARDHQYRRRYMLDHFSISTRKATPAERLEPFERYRRSTMKWLSRWRSFGEGCYLEQDGLNFDERLLTIKVKDVLHLDGYWQSEDYFKDVEKIIREDFRIKPPKDELNQRMFSKILRNQAVAMHVRWFDAPGNMTTHNMSTKYYQRAFALMEERVTAAHYFLFSDQPEAARKKLALPEEQVTFVSHNRGDENAYADLWLMTQCKHFITANSTFSWWGAWLGEGAEKIVVTPDLKLDGKAAWGFKGLIPSEWVKV